MAQSDSHNMHLPKELRGGNQFYQDCHMLGLIIVSTVKLKANAFPSSSSSLGLQGISHHAAHFLQSTKTNATCSQENTYNMNSSTAISTSIHISSVVMTKFI